MIGNNYPFSGKTVFEKSKGEINFFWLGVVVCIFCLVNLAVADTQSEAIAGETAEVVTDDMHTRMHKAEREIARRDNLLVVCKNLHAERTRELNEVNEKWNRVTAGVHPDHVPESVRSERVTNMYNVSEYWKSQLVLAGCYDYRWDM